jgi:hypothetical protein
MDGVAGGGKPFSIDMNALQCTKPCHFIFEKFKSERATRQTGQPFFHFPNRSAGTQILSF